MVVDGKQLAKQARLDKKVCHKCKATIPKKATICRKCGSTQSRVKAKEARR